MNQPQYLVRRATVDDLEALRRLWKEACLPVDALEKHLTEFQVVVSQAGEFMGALGVSIKGSDAKLHSEAFAHPEIEDQLRPQMWERLQRVAQNHGLARFWTQEEAPFWQHYAGLKPATTAELSEMPADFGPRESRWLTLQLREKVAADDLIEKELALFRQSQQENQENLLRQTRRIKFAVTLIASLLLGVVILAALFVMSRQNWRFGR